MAKDVEFNQKLIYAIEKIYPKKSDQVRLLKDAIGLGREASYRRLRNEISFTFAEACLLSKSLGISLNSIALIDNVESHVFHFRINPSDLENYAYHKLFEHEDSFKMLLNGSVLYTMSACSAIPYSFFLPYENLSKFRLFKWIYQTENKLIPSKFSDIVLPQNIQNIQRHLGSKLYKMPENIFIFDRNMFASCLDEFKYFYNLGLITDEELSRLKNEFRQSMEDFETLAVHGKNQIGQRVWVYLSNIDFDSSYTFVKGIDFERAYIDGIYLMDTIVSSDPVICKMHREWIESLRKYSTLISVSGEMQRRSFFEKQKMLIDTI